MKIDTDLIGKQIDVEIAGERDDVRIAERHEEQAAKSRASAKARRLRIGGLLAKARGAWPERGPNAKGWGEFLAARKIDDATARRYIEEHNDPDGFAQKQRKLSENSGVRDDDGDRDPKPANVHGGSGEVKRGSFCTPKKWAIAVGTWDVDPFSNLQSNIVAKYACMLETGGDGFGDPTVPGSYRYGPAHTDCIGRADETTRVWLQPIYERGFVVRVVRHYRHTRFGALLRWAPDTAWFGELWPAVQAVAFPIGERIAFETPDGVLLSGGDEDGDDEDRGAPFPHAFYFADPRDITPAIAETCIVLTRYQAAAHPALHIVP